MSAAITTIESTARTLARFARHLPDRILHPWRRRHLSNAIARLGRVHGILFVCHGNICRSPYAAAVFAQRLPAALRSHIKVASAGFIGPGRPAPSEARTVAARHGVDLSNHRSQLVTAPGLDTYELVVVMAPDQVKGLATAYPGTTRIIVLGDLDPEPISKRAIIDPFGHPEEIFDESYARIDRCLDALILQMFAFAK